MVSATELAVAVPGAGVSFSVRTKSAFASSVKITFSDELLCQWLYGYVIQMLCIANQHSFPYLCFVAVLMLARGMRTIAGVPMSIP